MIKVIHKIFMFVIDILQIFLLLITYYFFKLIALVEKIFKKSKNNSCRWVIGVREIANTIYFLGQVLKPSITVCLYENIFYNNNYNFIINHSNYKLNYILRIFYGPILFGYLVSKNTHFWYLWTDGFLKNRKYELQFLKLKGKVIIFSFVGNDIRSPKKMLELIKRLSYDHYINYYSSTSPQFLTEQYENEKVKIAALADEYADLIFSCPVDQISYLKKKQYFFPYIYPEDRFFYNEKKFENLSLKKLKILHAPSNPIIKGTPLVRAAIKKLKMEGYDFEYIELQNVNNQIVLEELKTTHIVLNQFYAFVPGLFGIEALANHCCVLMSADPIIEKNLPQNFQDSWVITKYWEIYDNLKYLLENLNLIKYYADKGFEYAFTNFNSDNAKNYIFSVLKQNKIIN